MKQFYSSNRPAKVEGLEEICVTKSVRMELHGKDLDFWEKEVNSILMTAIQEYSERFKRIMAREKLGYQILSQLNSLCLEHPGYRSCHIATASALVFFFYYK